MKDGRDKLTRLILRRYSNIFLLLRDCDIEEREYLQGKLDGIESVVTTLIFEYGGD